MSLLVAAFLGAGTGIGVLLVLGGLAGRRLLPRPRWNAADPTAAARQTIHLAISIATVLLVLAVTRWPAAGVLAGLGAWFGPRAFGGRKERDRVVARTEAIASWTEMIRDSIVAASGLEEAIIATGTVAPQPIAAEVHRLVRRLDHQPLTESLVGFGRDLHHPSGDLVVTALVLASEMESSDLSGLLSRLAEATRGEARMRIRVEVGRSRVRTAAKIILGVVGATIVLLSVANRGYLAVYGDSAGQFVLLVIGLIFGFGGWLMTRMAAIELPERFTARAIPTPATRGTAQ